jgi:hypothetical protein
MPFESEGHLISTDCSSSEHADCSQFRYSQIVCSDPAGRLWFIVTVSACVKFHVRFGNDLHLAVCPVELTALQKLNVSL